MSFLRVRSSFCGGSLERGTRTIAHLGVVISFVGLVIGLLVLASAPPHQHWAVAVARLAGHGVAIALSLVLLYGAHRRSTAFLLAYLVVKGFVLILICILIPASLGLLAYAVSKGVSGHQINLVFFWLFFLVILMPLWVYLYAIVYSFYRELKETSPTKEPLVYHISNNLVKDPEVGHPVYDPPPPYKN